jgi:hypothetical protein
MLPVPVAQYELLLTVTPRLFPWKKPRSLLRGFSPDKVLRPIRFFDAWTWPDGLL